MIPRGKFELPPDREKLRAKGVRLQWVSIGALLAIVVAMYAVMGSSQAMKTAWAEDLLSLVPPIAYLIATPITKKSANLEYPYGYHRAITIAFLCAAVALLATGLFLLGESIYTLAAGEHPTIASIDLFGWHVWQGWPMIAVLLASGIAPVILGHKKLPLARQLHDKALDADADMNRADWLTALAGSVGIAGIALGWWWADSVAAAVIALAITHDGAKNLRRAVEDLIDRAPTKVEDGSPHPLRQDARRALLALPWVKRAAVRLREEGHMLSGEAFVVPVDEADLVARLEQARDTVQALDWRIGEVVASAVRELPDEETSR